MSTKTISHQRFDLRWFSLLLAAMVAIGFTLFNVVAIGTIVTNRVNEPVLVAPYPPAGDRLFYNETSSSVNQTVVPVTTTLPEPTLEFGEDSPPPTLNSN